MKKALQFFMLQVLLSGALTAQSAGSVEVADLTLTVEGRNAKELYYAFAAGDRIVLDMQEIGGKPLSGIEVVEYPANVKFREISAATVREKTIGVGATGVYIFRFMNEEKKDRTAKVRISRIPVDESMRGFPSAVKWVEQYDTIVQSNVARMETQRVRLTRKFLTKVDTSVVSLLDRTERLNSRSRWGGQTAGTISVELPANRASNNREEELVAWSYWIGVGNEAEAQYMEANRMIGVGKSATKAAVTIGLLSSGYGALAVLAMEGVALFVSPAKGDNVKFRILGNDKLLDEGNAIASFARNTNFTQGTLAFELANDNLIDALDVQLRVVAVIQTRHYEEEEYYEDREVPVIDKKIQVRKVPVVGN
jgi:hypothetical protein